MLFLCTRRLESVRQLRRRGGSRFKLAMSSSAYVPCWRCECDNFYERANAFFIMECDLQQLHTEQSRLFLRMAEEHESHQILHGNAADHFSQVGNFEACRAHRERSSYHLGQHFRLRAFAQHHERQAQEHSAWRQHFIVEMNEMVFEQRDREARLPLTPRSSRGGSRDR